MEFVLYFIPQYGRIDILPPITRAFPSAVKRRGVARQIGGFLLAAQNIRLEGIRILGLGHNPQVAGVRLEVEARSGSPTMCNRPVETCSEAAVDEVSTTLVA